MLRSCALRNVAQPTGLLLPCPTSPAQLAPCQSGASEACCTAINNLAAIGGSGPLAGCLCYPEVLDETISTVESNALARAAGVTGDTVFGVLKECGVPFASSAGGSGCPATGGQGAGAQQRRIGELHGARIAAALSTPHTRPLTCFGAVTSTLLLCAYERELRDTTPLPPEHACHRRSTCQGRRSRSCTHPRPGA